MTQTTTESGENANAAFHPHKKNRTTANIGETVSIPGHATGITVSDLSPFGETVQVSWLEPVGGDDKGVTNELEVFATRTSYADESPVEVPYWAVAPTLWEPPESSESVVYWLG